jgi:hypothetical protein
MRKRFMAGPPAADTAPADETWMDLDAIADVEITSEDPAHPIESALLPGRGPGWRAAAPGKQSIRLLFHQPQALRRIYVKFVEAHSARTQEFALRASADGGRTFRDVVRQQWNFDPRGAASETEDYRVELTDVTTLELDIVPDVGGGNAVASLDAMRLA